MKIFKSSFRKALSSKDWFVAMIVFIFFFILIIPSINFNVPSLLFLVMFLIISLHILIIQCFYIVLTDERLIIKNSIYVFWKKEAFFENIEKVKIIYAGGLSYPYMQIHTRKTKKISWRYIINLVDLKDYSALIEAIRTEGVLVETEGLDDYINLFKKRFMKPN